MIGPTQVQPQWLPEWPAAARQRRAPRPVICYLHPPQGHSQNFHVHPLFRDHDTLYSDDCTNAILTAVQCAYNIRALYCFPIDFKPLSSCLVVQSPMIYLLLQRSPPLSSSLLVVAIQPPVPDQRHDGPESPLEH